MAKIDFSKKKGSITGSLIKEDDTYKVVKIAFEKIVANDVNFYSLDNIEDLAEDIQIAGKLIEPLVVSQFVNEDKETMYRIISGHRRFLAISLLMKQGSEIFKQGVPCFIAKTVDVLEEQLLLIQSNAYRTKTPFEITKEIELLTKIYQAKKENGEEIPKNKRKYLIERSGLSNSQIQRHETIAKGLSEELKEPYEKGEIAFNTAFELAKLPKEKQEEMVNGIKDKEGVGAKKVAKKGEKNILLKEVKAKQKDNEEQEVFVPSEEISADEVEIFGDGVLNHTEVLQMIDSEFKNLVKIAEKDEIKAQKIMYKLEKIITTL